MGELSPREGKQCTQRLTASQLGETLRGERQESFFKVVLFPQVVQVNMGKGHNPTVTYPAKGQLYAAIE